MCLFPENIIFQKISAEKYKVRIVNDIGTGILIPLEYYFHYFAKKESKKTLERVYRECKTSLSF